MADSQSNTSVLKSGIYAIRCTVTGKIYIGSAVNIKARWHMHRSHLTRNMHHSKYMQRAWNKHGPDAFYWEILEYVETPRLLEREQYYMDSLQAADKQYGFNMSPTAGSALGVKHSPEARARQAEISRNPSPETRAKMASAKLGKTLSQETRAKMSAVRSGKRLSPEHRAKMSAARAGTHPSLETRAKMSEANQNWPPERRAKLSEANRGKTLSAETRAKMSESRRGKPRSLETKAKIGVAHRGKKASPESRAKMSESRLGKRRKAFTAETIAKMRVAAAQREALKRQSKLNSRPVSRDQSFFQWPED